MPNGHVLLIEDDPDLVSLIAWRLRRRGHEVSVAFDGSEGYFAALRERPDVVVLDLMLPGFTGSELMHLLRTNPDTRRIPILVISALPHALRSTTDDRPDDDLEKPFDLEHLVRRVESLLEKRAALAASGDRAR